MTEHWNGGSGGKGSKPRPYSVDANTFANNWDAIFGKKKKQEDNTGVTQNEFQDVLRTEDCAVDELERYKQQAQESFYNSCASNRSK